MLYKSYIICITILRIVFSQNLRSNIRKIVGFIYNVIVIENNFDFVIRLYDF